MYDRSKSLLQLTSPVGTDVLIPTFLSGHEEIGRPYAYKLKLVSEDSTIDPNRLLHQPGCVILRRDKLVARYFAGVFQEFSADGPARPGMASYSALLVPKLWFLNQTIDCRVFQQMSIVDILQQVFDDAGLPSVTFRIFGDRPKLGYITQFNETDFQFATRLMEEAGYFYFFEHAAGGETLIVADANAAFDDIPEGQLRFDSAKGAEDVLEHWQAPSATAWGSVTLKDYDPASPSTILQATHQASDGAPGGQSRDVFYWPATRLETERVADRAQRMIEASQVEVAQSSGAGIFRNMVAGGRFTVVNPGGQSTSTCIVRWLSIGVVDESWVTGGASSQYHNSFVCFPDEVPWRHPITPSRPRMAGVYSAIVLGPSGEEIYVDDLGRIKVRLMWDWRNETNADQAIWARVIQPWAGGGFGGQFTPRVGMEVAVAFVDGDPDRPVIIGGLYNGNQQPIYSAADKTKSGFRSRSSPGGGSGDFNEFTFDDKTGQELVYLRAQKDIRSEVVHDATHTVGNDRTRTVGAAEKVDIGTHQTITVGQGRSTTISQADDTLDVAQGDLSITVDQGKVSITAMQSIDLQVGGSTIHIDQNGISISAMSVSINGQMTASMSSPMVSISGDASTDISGGVVTINS